MVPSRMFASSVPSVTGSAMSSTAACIVCSSPSLTRASPLLPSTQSLTPTEKPCVHSHAFTIRWMSLIHCTVTTQPYWR